MGSKYIIDCFNYPYNGIDYEVQSSNFISFIFNLIKCIIKFDGINVSIRN